MCEALYSKFTPTEAVTSINFADDPGLSNGTACCAEIAATSTRTNGALNTKRIYVAFYNVVLVAVSASSRNGHSSQLHMIVRPCGRTNEDVQLVATSRHKSHGKDQDFSVAWQADASYVFATVEIEGIGVEMEWTVVGAAISDQTIQHSHRH